MSRAITSPCQSWWHTERSKLERRWCAFVGHELSMICDGDSERLYTVCQSCGEKSPGIALHTVPVRHVWMRDRYELWLKYLETLRVPKSRAKMRLVSKA
jgi:hypothetical protein